MRKISLFFCIVACMVMMLAVPVYANKTDGMSTKSTYDMRTNNLDGTAPYNSTAPYSTMTPYNNNGTAPYNGTYNGTAPHHGTTRTYGVHDNVNNYRSTDMYNNTYRTRAAATTTRTGMNWGWLGLLGLIGLAGMRSRDRERT